MSSFVNLLDIIYPVNSIYQSFDATSPAETVGGTWERISSRFIYGTSDDSALLNTAGESSHTLTVNEMPSHNHYMGTWILHDAGSWASRGSTNQGTYNTPFINTALDWPYAGGGRRTTTCPHTSKRPSGEGLPSRKAGDVGCQPSSTFSTSSTQLIPSCCGATTNLLRSLLAALGSKSAKAPSSVRGRCRCSQAVATPTRCPRRRFLEHFGTQTAYPGTQSGLPSTMVPYMASTPPLALRLATHSASCRSTSSFVSGIARPNLVCGVVADV